MKQCFQKLTFLKGIELRSVADSKVYAPHFHENYTIGLLTSGSQIVQTGGKSDHAHAGSVQFHLPFQTHSNYPASPGGITFLHFEIAESRLREFLGNNPHTCRPNHILDSALFRSFRAVFLSLTTDDNLLAHDESLTAALTQLFSPPESANRLPDDAPRLVTRIRDFLHAHYAEPVTLDSLVKITNVSRVHLSRTFARHTGLAPHEYLLQLRVARAKAEIANGVPLAEVAALCGFADQSHLTRHFKRITRVTPGAYAKSCYKRSRQ